MNRRATSGPVADWRIVARFGLPAALAAIAGAGLLVLFADMPVFARYELAGQMHEITPVQTVIGVLIAGFALQEHWPRIARLSILPTWLTVGGLLSGIVGPKPS